MQGAIRLVAMRVEWRRWGYLVWPVSQLVRLFSGFYHHQRSSKINTFSSLTASVSFSSSLPPAAAHVQYPAGPFMQGAIFHTRAA
jgi:hypothetical protein